MEVVTCICKLELEEEETYSSKELVKAWVFHILQNASLKHMQMA